MFEKPIKAEKVEAAADWVGELKDPKINPDGSVGAPVELEPLVASYESDRKEMAIRERESTLGESVMSSAIGSEHIRMGGADETSDDLALKKAEEQMRTSMQEFFEASQAEEAARAEARGESKTDKL